MRRGHRPSRAARRLTDRRVVVNTTRTLAVPAYVGICAAEAVDERRIPGRGCGRRSATGYHAELLAAFAGLLDEVFDEVFDAAFDAVFDPLFEDELDEFEDSDFESDFVDDLLSDSEDDPEPDREPPPERASARLSVR